MFTLQRKKKFFEAMAKATIASITPLGWYKITAVLDPEVITPEDSTCVYLDPYDDVQDVLAPMTWSEFIKQYDEGNVKILGVHELTVEADTQS